MIGPRTLALVPRSVMRQSLARSHDAPYKGGVSTNIGIVLIDSKSLAFFPSQNVPFDTLNHRALAAKMIVYFAIPFALPFLVWRRRLAKYQNL